MNKKIYPFHYKPMPVRGQDQRHLLVFGNLQDAMPIPSNWEEQGNPPIKVPVFIGKDVCTWVSPQRLTLLEIDGDVSVPDAVIECYNAFVNKFKE
ncbi:hypothetical protein EBT16_05610 [bacterium]|nr:hypothetical protein [bacterium]